MLYAIFHMLYAICLDPGGYFRVEPITGRLYNQRPLLLTDPNWSAGHRTIVVQVKCYYTVFQKKVHPYDVRDNNVK